MKRTILFLSGMSKKNKALVEEAKSLFDTVETIEYDHWNSGKEIDIEKEKQKLSGTYDVVIAKSIGAYLALHAKAKKYVLMGFPLSYLQHKNIPIPKPKPNMILIQNKNDHAASIEELQKTFPNAKIITNHRDGHTYKVKDAKEFIQD